MAISAAEPYTWTMGHRANYAIRENGEISLHYSHWGALSIPEDMFWGPEHAERCIRQQEKVAVDDWLDDVWGEGGVALNLDEKKVVLFGGEALGQPPLRAVYLRLMRALWGQQGWTVEWAEVGMPAIAAAVGADPTLATAEPIPPTPIDLDVVGVDLIDEEGDFNLSCLISIEQLDGSFVHKVVDALATPMLANGKAFLDILDRLPLLEDFYELWEKPSYFGDDPWSLGNEFSSSIIIRPPKRKIEFRELYSNRSAQPFLSNSWKGWEIRQFEGSVEEHFERLGVELPEALRIADEDEIGAACTSSEDDLIQQVAVCLMSSARSNPAKMARQLMSDEMGEVWVNPEALKDPPLLDIAREDRSAIFGQALAAMLR